MKKESQRILEKYFESREYNKEKVRLWKDYSLEDVSKFLVERYINFGFVVSIIIIKLGDMRDDIRTMSRKNTDDAINVSI